MKRLLGIIVLSLLCTNFVYAESVYDFLKSDTEYSRGSNIQTIYAHNSHSSKTILVTKFEVMFTNCASVSDGDWNNPDRVYAINQKVFPQSDKEININARYPSSAKKRCTRLWGQFVSSNNTNNENLGSKQFLGTECINGRKYIVHKNSVTNKKSYLLTTDQTGECEEKKSKVEEKDKSKSTKKTETKQSASTFSPLAGYSSLLIMAGIIIAGLLFYIKSLSFKNKVETKSKKTKIYKSNIKKNNYSSSNFISTVWNGEETMSKTFWLYCVLIVAIVSFISGLVLGVVGNIIWVVPLSVIIWTNTGLWRSSSFYQNQKLKNKQSYGWASAAKVYVVINYILTFSQIGLSLSV